MEREPLGEREVLMYTRREFGLLALTGLVGLKRGAAYAGVDNAVVNGVHLGVQTYSFRDLPRTPDGDAVDTVIKAMTACGLVECELWSPQVEPQFSTDRGSRSGAPSGEAATARENLRKWRGGGAGGAF